MKTRKLHTKKYLVDLESRKTELLFLDGLSNLTSNYSYFIDLENIINLKYHYFNGFKYFCGHSLYNNSYNNNFKKNLNSTSCIFCDEKIDYRECILCDIILFNKQGGSIKNKCLYLSQIEYNTLRDSTKLLHGHKGLFIREEDSGINYMSHIIKLKDNKSKYKKHMVQSYEQGIQRLLKNYSPLSSE